MAADIEVKGIGKRYAIGVQAPGSNIPGLSSRYVTLRDGVRRTLMAPLNRLRGRKSHGDEEAGILWALRNVDFEIQPGESIGIIGRNGAGKSTLLKILSRITRPSEGEVIIRGRVGSLLEVGTGFHPELTGRENIDLNGCLLGMSRQEVARRFEEIADFAEVEGFLDTPVKRYSTGMLIRLAFSVAAHLEPEILLVDEVLAVGDAAFQKKCLGKMGRTAQAGRTVLLVSHNMTALERLCTRAIWIDKGGVVEDGPVTDVVAKYLATSFAPVTECIWESREEAPGNDDIRLARACVRPRDGTAQDPMSIRTPLVFEFDYWNLKPGAHLTVMLQLCTERGDIVFSSESVHEQSWHGRDFPEGLFSSTCHVPGDLLNDGTHYVRLLFRQDEGLAVYENEDLLTLEIRDDVAMRGASNSRWPGVVRPNLEWTTRRLDGSDTVAP